jgi:thymidylate synthase (FAD)
MNEKRINVDDGSIVLIDHMGDDLAVVNAARVSFGKASTELTDRDVKLIQYLAEHKHMSPFRHVVFKFTLEDISEVVIRQLFRHQVGCAYTSNEFREVATVWNEISGRYVEFEPAFHTPGLFRKQHKNNKQASVEGESVDDNEAAMSVYNEAVKQAYDAYRKLLDLGVCREQARMVMPLCFKTSVMWTVSLEALAHFIRLRDHDGAQLEIRNLARALDSLVRPLAPVSLAALLSH